MCGQIDCCYPPGSCKQLQMYNMRVAKLRQVVNHAPHRCRVSITADMKEKDATWKREREGSMKKLLEVMK